MTDKTKKQLEFIINTVFVLVLAGICYLIFKYVISWILPFLLALGLVALLNPLVRLIHNKLQINKKVITVLIVALLYTLAGTLLFLLGARLAFAAKDLFQILPDFYRESISPSLSLLGQKIDVLLQNIPGSFPMELDSIQEALMNGLQEITGVISQRGLNFASGLTTSVPIFIMNLLFTVMLSFFISIQYDTVIQFLNDQLPAKASSFLVELKRILKNTVFRYLKAYLILMTMTFIELSIGLLIIRMPNAILIAAGIAIFDALPVFGTGGIMIPWILLELLQGNVSLALSIAILYGVVTLIRNIFEPKIVGDQLGLNPIVSLMAIYLGFRLFGIFGMIFCPMGIQILLALHQSGSLKLYRVKEKD